LIEDTLIDDVVGILFMHDSEPFGGFVQGMMMSWQRADNENRKLIKPALCALILKYKILQKYETIKRTKLPARLMSERWLKSKGHAMIYDNPILLKFQAQKLNAVIMLHSDFLTLNGYLEIPRSWKVDTNHLNAHGGITYTGDCFWKKRSKNVAIGFDCCHYDDYNPGMRNTMKLLSMGTADAFDKAFPSKGHNPLETYRDVKFVTHELQHLARQLREQFGWGKV